MSHENWALAIAKLEKDQPASVAVAEPDNGIFESLADDLLGFMTSREGTRGKQLLGKLGAVLPIGGCFQDGAFRILSLDHSQMVLTTCVLNGHTNKYIEVEEATLFLVEHCQHLDFTKVVENLRRDLDGLAERVLGDLEQ